jgi:D-glycero-D-manno-heptose 1,7-bisphosphate phosphatase
MLNRAVFFDRDNTLNHDPGYLNDPSKLKLFPDVPSCLAKLKKHCGFKLVVISNQSGITRGLITKEEVDSIHEEMNRQLSKEDVSIDAFYYCPYHPDFDPPEKLICRKPSPYLVVKAAEQLKIDLSKSYFVGDRESDIICGINAGTKTVLLNYNNSNELTNTLNKAEKSPNFIASNFNDMCEFIISDFLGERN